MAVGLGPLGAVGHEQAVVVPLGCWDESLPVVVHDGWLIYDLLDISASRSSTLRPFNYSFFDLIDLCNSDWSLLGLGLDRLFWW